MLKIKSLKGRSYLTAHPNLVDEIRNPENRLQWRPATFCSICLKIDVLPSMDTPCLILTNFCHLFSLFGQNFQLNIFHILPLVLGYVPVTAYMGIVVLLMAKLTILFARLIVIARMTSKNGALTSPGRCILRIFSTKYDKIDIRVSKLGGNDILF